MAKFFTILTHIGAALHANAQIQQSTVPWTHMALGDGNGVDVNPTQAQTGLIREVHRLPITAIDPHPTNPNWIVVEAVVPNSVGGWTVREAAIFGGAGGVQCIAVGNYPASYKPVLADGAVREMVMRMIVEISSTATVNLVIDPAVAIASRGWVENLKATTEKRGIAEIATDAECDAGTDEQRFITPKSLRSIVPKTSFLKGIDTSADKLEHSGLYYLMGSSNGPTPEFSGWIRHSAVNQGVFAYQEAFDAGASFWKRAQYNGLWGKWVAILNQDEINQIKSALENGIASKEPKIAAGAADQYWAGDKTWKPVADMPVRTATTARTGVSQLATDAETLDGSDAQKVVTPKALRAAVPKVAFLRANGTDANDIEVSGLYYVNGSLNGPSSPAAFAGWIRHSAVTPGVFAYQEAFDPSASFWRRAQYNGQWGKWIAVQNLDEINQIKSALENGVASKEPTIAAGAANQYWAGDKTWKPVADIAVRTATTARTGVSQLATDAETLDGNDAQKVVTPKALRAAVPKEAFLRANGTDANGIEVSGLYYVNGSLNGPSSPAPFAGWIRHSAVTPGVFAYQEAFDPGASFWRRAQYNGQWGKWIVVLNQDEINQIKSALENGIASKEPTIAAGAADQYWAGDKTWKPVADMAVRTATTARTGVSQLATDAETLDGNDAQKVVTPKALRAAVPKVAFLRANGTDANDIEVSGLYYVNGSLNGPSSPAAFAGWIRHSAVTPGVFAYQEAFDPSATFWRRAQYNGQWGKWIAVLNLDEINQIKSALEDSIASKEPKIAAGGANQYWAGDKTWKPAADMPIRSATEDAAGVSEVATQAETNAGADDVRIVTPKKLAVFALKDPANAQRGMPVTATDAELATGTHQGKMVTPFLLRSLLGVGQSWLNLNGSRLLSIVYTNTTARPIYVTVRGITNVGISRAMLFANANGIESQKSYDSVGDEGIAISFIVFPGLSYQVTAIGVRLTDWMEYR